MQVIEAFGLGDAQPLEQREDHQRGEALGRRRRVEHGAGLERDRQRLGERRAAALEIGARHRAADAFEIGGDLAPDIAAIEIVEPGMREMVEGGGKRGLLEGRAGVGRLAVHQERLREARHVLELGKLLGGEPGLAARDEIAFTGVADRGRQQFAERQARAMRLGNLERQVQPAIAPGTVSAASGPRGGMVS